MPLFKRCCVCGRLCEEKPHSAEPYKRGYACSECYVKTIIPSAKMRGDKFYKYGGKI